MRLPTEIVIATSNRHKVVEFQSIMSEWGVRGIALLDAGAPVAVPVESGVTFSENAILKASYYASHLGRPCLADDSGLCVEALGGAPGINSSRYADTDARRIARLLEELDAAGAMMPSQRKAKFVCAVCLALPGGRIIESEGVCEGRIAPCQTGEGGFGYDPVFYLPAIEKTMAQLSTADKNNRSHRGAAIRALMTLFADGD